MKFIENINFLKTNFPLKLILQVKCHPSERHACYESILQMYYRKCLTPFQERDAIHGRTLTIISSVARVRQTGLLRFFKNWRISGRFEAKKDLVIG
jgi:hypothetical protein